MINREGLDTIQAMAKQAVVTIFEGMRDRGWAIFLRAFPACLFGLGLSRRCFWLLSCRLTFLFLSQDVTTQTKANLTPFVVGRRGLNTSTWLVAAQAEILATSVVSGRPGFNSPWKRRMET